VTHSFNKVFLIGDLDGNAPEYFDIDGVSTASFVLDGWHFIEARDALADYCRTHLSTGFETVHIEGSLLSERIERESEPGTFDVVTTVLATSILCIGAPQSKQAQRAHVAHKQGAAARLDAAVTRPPAAPATRTPVSEAPSSRPPAPAPGGHER